MTDGASAGTRGPTDRPLVVGYDGSPESARAASAGVDLARALHAEVVFVHAFEATAEVLEPVTEEELQSRARVDARILQDLVDQAGRRDVRARAVQREGEPVGVILGVAREVGAGLLVVGTRGRRGAAKLVLGSVSAGVLAGASVPVLVVR